MEWRKGERSYSIHVWLCYNIKLYNSINHHTCVHTLHGCWYSNLLAVASQDSVLSLRFWVVEAGMPWVWGLSLLCGESSQKPPIRFYRECARLASCKDDLSTAQFANGVESQEQAPPAGTGERALSELRSKNQNPNQLAGAETHGNQLREMSITVGLPVPQVAIPAAPV